MIEGRPAPKTIHTKASSTYVHYFSLTHANVKYLDLGDDKELTIKINIE